MSEQAMSEGHALVPGSFASVGVGRTFCLDCGVEAWHQWDENQDCYVHEDFYVHDELWRSTCRDDPGIVLCIGCFEDRLGRRLVAGDFKPSDPDGWYWSVLVGRSSSRRFQQRLQAQRQ